MNGPSIHLSWAELACKDAARTPYPEEWRDDRAVVLAAEFEVVRHDCGDVPIEVLSAYRTPTHNRKVGGKPNSQHPEGRALDLKNPKHLTLDEFYRIIHARASMVESRIFGLGLYPTFVHMDVRPGPRFVVWRGSRAWAELKTSGAQEPVDASAAEE